mgnify:CR=1 FL=1
MGRTVRKSPIVEDDSRDRQGDQIAEANFIEADNLEANLSGPVSEADNGAASGIGPSVLAAEPPSTTVSTGEISGSASTTQSLVDLFATLPPEAQATLLAQLHPNLATTSPQPPQTSTHQSAPEPVITAPRSAEPTSVSIYPTLDRQQYAGENLQTIFEDDGTIPTIEPEYRTRGRTPGFDHDTYEEEEYPAEQLASQSLATIQPASSLNRQGRVGLSQTSTQWINDQTFEAENEDYQDDDFADQPPTTSSSSSSAPTTQYVQNRPSRTRKPVVKLGEQHE